MKMWSGLFWIAWCLSACTLPEPAIPEMPPATAQAFLDRLAEVANNGLEVAPAKLGRALATTFIMRPDMPTGRESTCSGWQHSWETYDPAPSFWFRRTLPQGPDRSASPGSLQARFIPRDPSFRYSIYLTEDCRPRGSVTFEDVGSWLCISRTDTENAGYNLHHVFDAPPAYGREIIRRETGSSTAVTISFRGACASLVSVNTFYPSAELEHEERLRRIERASPAR